MSAGLGKFKRWFLARNRSIAGWTAIAVFFILIFIAIALNSRSKWTCQKESQDTSRSPRLAASSPKCWLENYCNVKCANFEQSTLGTYVKEALNASCGTFFNLLVENVQFPNNIIGNHWLDGLEGYNIVELNLNGCKFDDVEKGALSGSAVSSIQQLIIIDSAVSFLYKHYFEDLEMLTSFAFRFEKNVLPLKVGVEAGIFEKLIKLETIQIDKSLWDPVAVSNITGKDGAFLFPLKMFDLRDNMLRTLESFSFKNAPNLESVYLNRNGMTHLPKDAFWGSPIRLIDVSNNQLGTIENGIFKDLMINHQVEFNYGYVYLGQNPWICNCSLKWLQEYFLQPDTTVAGVVPMCNNLNIGEYFFNCSSTPTTVALVTTTTTDIPKTESSTIPEHQTSSVTTSILQTSDKASTAASVTSTDESIRLLKCRNLEVNPARPNQRIVEAYDAIDFHCTGHKFYFYDLEDDLNQQDTTSVVIEGNLDDYNFLAFQSFNKDEKVCFTDLTSDPLSMKLQRNTAYTMCMVKRGETTVLPCACFGMRVLEDWGSRSWIPHNKKVIILVITGGVLLFSIILCAVCTFFYIRQHPNLIKGNKRVIIVGKQDTQAIIMPKNYPNPAYAPPSLIASGYMTPNIPLYDRVHYISRRKPSFSEDSVHSYITTADYPKNIPKRYGDEIPPPLPPPNQHRENIVEQIYTSA